MVESRGSHAARRGPQPGRRIVEFRARERAAGVNSSSDEHLAVGQERRGIEASPLSHAVRRGPQPSRWIIEFRAREKDEDSSPSDEHLAVGQERRRIEVSRGSHAARRDPRTRCLRWRFRSGCSSYRLTEPSQSREDADGAKSKTD